MRNKKNNPNGKIVEMLSDIKVDLALLKKDVSWLKKLVYFIIAGILGAWVAVIFKA